MVTSFQIDFIDFILVKETRIAVLDEGSLSFYDVDNVFNLNKKIRVKGGKKYQILMINIYYMQLKKK